MRGPKSLAVVEYLSRDPQTGKPRQTGRHFWLASFFRVDAL